ncbi:MAG: hypothetical protein WDO24_03615 [Pseudomonadota bacterium]
MSARPRSAAGRAARGAGRRRPVRAPCQPAGGHAGGQAYQVGLTQLFDGLASLTDRVAALAGRHILTVGGRADLRDPAG